MSAVRTQQKWDGSKTIVSVFQYFFLCYLFILLGYSEFLIIICVCLKVSLPKLCLAETKWLNGCHL